MAECSGVR